MEEFSRFGDLMPEPLLLISSRGEVLGANRRISRLLDGVSPSELIGRSLYDLTGNGAEMLDTWLRACARSRDLLPATLRLLPDGGDAVECRAAGGVYRPASGADPALILVRLAPKRDAVDPFLALNLRIEELTAEVARRRRAEVALQAEQEWLRVTLQSIGDAVIATDETGHVTFMNRVAEQLTGWSEKEATGLPLGDVFVIVNEQTRQAVESPVVRVLREGAVVGLANHTLLIRKDGEQVAIDDSGAPIRGDHGHLIGVVLVFHDITERRALERELEARNQHLVEADRRKDEFLAMLAHELRNPLAPLGNGVEILRSTSLEPGALAELGDMMGRQIRHLSHLVNDLLDVSRITRGRIELHRQPLDLKAALNNALEMVAQQIHQRRHHLAVELPDGPMPVEGDPNRLAQVFSNLLSNAAKFTDPGGRITLSAAQSPDACTVRIRDNGMGIEPEFLGSIFELFTQADRSLDRSQGGLGLGLTLSRQVVEMHGGTITARSEGIGRGSEFIVTLPGIQAAAPTPGQEPVAPDQTRKRTGKRVLVVDDNRDAAETLAMMVELWGHEVRIANDGLKALEDGARFAPDVVLLDLGLPGLDGFEVARRMRDHDVLRNVTLVAVTGYGRSADRQVSREAGFDDHLTKPVEPDVLARLLGRS